LILLLAGGGEGGERAAVEGAGGGEDLVASAAVIGAPAPRELHGRLVRLGAAVAEKGPLGERMPAEQGGQLRRRGAVVNVRGMQQPRRLRLHGLDHGGMAVPEVVDGEAGEEVEVALAVGVPQL